VASRALTRPMLGFKNFESAAISIAGIELLRRIHKGQFTLRQLRAKTKLRLRSGTRCLRRKYQKLHSIRYHLIAFAICTSVVFPLPVENSFTCRIPVRRLRAGSMLQFSG
jgi:hypothetical protein